LKFQVFVTFILTLDRVEWLTVVPHSVVTILMYQISLEKKYFVDVHVRMDRRTETSFIRSTRSRSQPKSPV